MSISLLSPKTAWIPRFNTRPMPCTACTGYQCGLGSGDNGGEDHLTSGYFLAATPRHVP